MSSVYFSRLINRSEENTKLFSSSPPPFISQKVPSLSRRLLPLLHLHHDKRIEVFGLTAGAFQHFHLMGGLRESTPLLSPSVEALPPPLLSGPCVHPRRKVGEKDLVCVLVRTFLSVCVFVALTLTISQSLWTG